MIKKIILILKRFIFKENIIIQILSTHRFAQGIIVLKTQNLTDTLLFNRSNIR